MNDCIFCQIRDKKIPANIAFESENLLAFPDINPVADVHIVIVPKEHIAGVLDITDNGSLLSEIYRAVEELVKKNNLETQAYRIVVNGAKAQHVPHLHFHLIGGQSLEWGKN
ncbi:MAG: HIT domain-containing protein [Candidatus Daviesbacteria bacterium]|nr:HIT domain-containing protein [Candidatus Daviesbacteria bacterium]